MFRAAHPALALALAALLPSAAMAFEGYYQHPTVHSQSVVFQSEGDLWLVGLEGGVAQRLTSHVEVESQPAFSPDGQQIAFLARYDGSTEVYVMPVTGGSPKRISFEDTPTSLEGWTPDGQVLISSTAIPGPPGRTVMRALDPRDGGVEDWPLVDANQGAVGPGGQRVVTRFGAHRKGDHVRQYRGGAMAELWLLEPGAAEATRLLAELNANVTDPLWVGERLVYRSDETGTWNLYSMRADGSDVRAHTAYTEGPVRRPDSDGSTIVFQRGADVFRLDPKKGEPERISIALRTDLDDARQRWVANPLSFDAGIELAPDGKRVTVTARGQVLVAGLPRTRRVDIGIPSSLRARGATLSPDGEWVYAIVSENGQDEIVRFSADGRGTREAITSGGEGRRWRFTLSPDGQRLAHSDSKGRLWITELDKRQTTRVASTPVGDDSFFGLTFSPDGRYLAYTLADGPRSRLFLHEVGEERADLVASERFSAYSPAFSPDGQWLWFLSDRHFRATPGAPWGDRVMGPMFDARTGIYALALTEDARFPFLPASLGTAPEPEDTGDEDTKKKKKKAKKKKKEDEQAPPVEIAWDGLSDRLYAVPVPSGNYGGLTATAGFLYVLQGGSGPDAATALKSIAIGEKAKVETFRGDVDGYDLSADGKQVLIHKDQAAWIVSAGAKAPDDLQDAQVDLGGWRLSITPADEWAQMFEDAWRLHRDLSFDPDMRGLDWEAVKARYAPLVPRITHRAELGDLLGEMASELDILHSQVANGELPRDGEGGREATLAAEFEPVEGGLRVSRIFRGDPDLLEERSPLSRPEVGIGVGDVLLSVNRQPVRSRADLSRALTDQVGRPVLLEVQDSDGETREVGTQPLSTRELYWRRYRHWEQTRRDAVDRASDGSIGYLHLHAMGGNDVADFAREYFAVSEREGLIVDVRGNRGGNVDSWIIGELSKTAWAFWQSPEGDQAYGSTNMQRAFRGHLVVLIDHGTYSDGETFAAGIKALDVAPLIGTTTAGAGIWLSDRSRLVDGGRARIAEYGQFDLDGNWIIEGRGVSPDIIVTNPPKASFEGQDAQLERAIEYLQKRIEEEPIPVLQGKPIPPVGTPAKDVERGRGR